MKRKIKDLSTSQNINLPMEELAEKYLKYLLGGSRNEAIEMILDAVEQGRTIPEIYLHIFQKTQQEIGRLWQTNQISVAQEHYCTAVTQSIMAQLYSHISTTQKNNQKAIIACVGGELHEIGALMVADSFELHGWNTYYVGANTPSDTLLRSIEDQKADIIGLSVTSTFNIPQTIELIALIKAEKLSNNLKIIVGGRAFNVAPELWSRLNADGYGEDFESAVETANQLFMNQKN